MKTLLLKTGYTIEILSTHEDFIDFKKNLDGNWGRIGSSVIRKMLKSIYLVCFTPLYFFFRGILWNQGKEDLLFVIARKMNE
ncbi:MAG: hypothetical protein AUJ28_02700 [Parcubacteria group bacterium CG1_02_37_51]|uniref:Uncharacterized protein n=1 Tax=Candidatus Roizmanbacteria bacterium CG_4_10_14_0_8_um_filter_39_9 TaxID=1974829 RepID=A0A2M7QE95_9BACT|nr:MAG: hypothetical protein AUJ28_02700 [Parcubacteria group bacterium CG1_02_37_51]PIY69200.1 MAG: hypothetical protein COY90_01910 [Candidatus Roizmanbacteria bacterium CG_4_10_14_0_8_um_filter_39_9]